MSFPSEASPINKNQRKQAVLEALESRRMLSSTAATLSKTDVEQILAAAASQALPTQVISVVDRNGDILGIYAGSQANLGPVRDQNGHLSRPSKLVVDSIALGTVASSVARARTGAFFESQGDAFTTRTARFIVQDHFPYPVENTPGGPLYGVEFSSLPTSDVYAGPAISGDPGGIPLFKGGVPVGGIGVAGDGHDVLARSDLPHPFKTTPMVFNGQEEKDFDEAVALAGATGFMAPSSITADKMLINGLRLPFTADHPATGKTPRSLASLIANGAGDLILADAATVGVSLEGNRDAGVVGRTTADVVGTPPSPYPRASFGGTGGFLKNTNPSAAGFGLVSGASRKGQHLTIKDVTKIITQTVNQALATRAGIRQPLGVPARVHVAVTDVQGNILGVFDMNDGTNFSYDVAVQKARTAAYFSDDTHAVSARAVGFISQRFFPTGIDNSRSGPLFHFQNDLSFDVTNPLPLALKNGITIFPGGVPLYKNGVLVGGLGISGDGVDQDDIITYGGSAGFRPPDGIRSDQVSGQSLADEITTKLQALSGTNPELSDIITQSEQRLKEGLLGVRLPYVKFPRNPLRGG